MPLKVASREKSRNCDFQLHYTETPGTAPNMWSLESMQVAVLMDIRDELQTLNRLLGCRNFTEIPQTLRMIRENTTKRPRKVKV